MTSKKQTYKVGDKLMHPYLGGAIIQNIVKLPNSRNTKYYHLKIVSQDSLKHYVPVDRITNSNFNRVKKDASLKKSVRNLKISDYPTFRKTTTIKTAVEQKMDTPTLQSVTSALGTLAKFFYKSRKQGKKISFSLKKSMQRAKQLYASYVALLKNQKYSEAEEYVDKLLDQIYAQA